MTQREERSMMQAFVDQRLAETACFSQQQFLGTIQE
jgi:hypothetical protein